MGSKQPNEDEIMETLKIFASGGYFESKLRDEDYTVHPFHDELYKEPEGFEKPLVPELGKFYLDDSLPEFIEEAKVKGK